MYCETSRCNNPAAKHNKKCWKCIKRKYRERHPIKAAYQNLRANAKRRKKSFELTFPEFSKWCIKYQLLSGVDKWSETFSIDRIDNDRGYSIDNIQVLTIKENASKGKKLVYDWRMKYARVVTTGSIKQDNSAPF